MCVCGRGGGGERERERENERAGERASSQKSAYSRSLLPLKWVSFDTCLLCASERLHANVRMHAFMNVCVRVCACVCRRLRLRVRGTQAQTHRHKDTQTPGEGLSRLERGISFRSLMAGSCGARCK